MNRLFINIIASVVIVLSDMVMVLMCNPLVEYLSEYLVELLPQFGGISSFILTTWYWHSYILIAGVVGWLILSSISREYDSDFGDSF